MRTDGNAKQVRLPVTPKGFVCLASGLTFLSAGILRGELAAALCGAIFTGFFFFGLTCAAVACLRWKSARLSIDWEQDRTKGLHVTCHHPRWNRGRIAFVRIFCAVHYETDTGLSFDLEVPLEGKETFWKPRLPARGVYSAAIPSVIVCDYPGFFRFSLHEKGTETAEPLVVFPAPESTESIAWPAGKTGTVRGRSVFKRSDEPFDSRPYHLGDDPRKIHWKQYAHTSALSVRQGDLLPPPASEFLFIVNAENDDTLTPSERKRFSVLMNRLAWTSLKLLGDSKIVSIGIAAAEEKRRIITVHPDDPDGRQKLFTALAEPQLTQTITNTQEDSFDATDLTTVFVTLPPTSPQGLGEILSARFDLVLAGPKINGMRSFSISRFLRALLFVSESFAPEKDAKLFASRLASFMDALRAEGIHAETL
jgi:hypothetical protein